MLRPRDFAEKIRKKFVSVISLFFLLWTTWYQKKEKNVKKTLVYDEIARY